MAKTSLKKPVSNLSQNNILRFDRVKRTKSGYAIFVGKNVLFLNDGLINYLRKNQKAS